jgi:hypothetical protein
MNCEELHSYRDFANSAVNGFRLFRQPQLKKFKLIKVKA